MIVFSNNLLMYRSKNDSGELIRIENEGSDIVLDSEELIKTQNLKSNEDVNKDIYVVKISEDYLRVDCNKVSYILNKNLEIIASYEDGSSHDWSDIYNGEYYYINDLGELIKLNLETAKKEIIYLSNKVNHPIIVGDIMYFGNESYNLCTYSFIDKTVNCLIAEKAAFEVYDCYIYYSFKDDCNETKKYISDLNGNILFDYSEYEHMGSDGINYICGRIYFFDSQIVGCMNSDGSDYVEYKY